LVFGLVSPSATHACGWLTHESPVIPAKAGIQVLNGIARLARDTQKLIAGGSAPAPWVTFFARAKKVTKESTPPDGATAPCASRRSRRAPQLAGRQLRASGSNTRRATPPIPAARLGRAIRGIEQPISDRYAEMFSTHIQHDKKC
jgi:hypothetical protein